MRQPGRRNIGGLDSRARGLGLGGVLAAATLALILVIVPSAQAASLKTPKSVSVGKKMSLAIRGFPPKSPVVFSASLDGPAALAGRRLGQTRTNSSGRATFRTRFPSTYQSCDADRRCSSYKWTKKRATYRRCGGQVRLSAGDLARQIKAKHLSCRKAKGVIKGPATKLGYRCKTAKKNGFPRITCTKGRKAVRFTYIQS